MMQFSINWPKLIGYSKNSFKPKIITKHNDAELWLQKAIPNYKATGNGPVGYKYLE